MKKYKSLRTIATIFKILGILSLVLTILLALASCLFYGIMGASFSSLTGEFSGLTGGESGVVVAAGIILGLFILIYGGFSSLMIYGAGELIFVLLDMEQNTRETAELMRIAARNASPSS